jgi:Na+-driven multidrug efflux pump
MILLSGYISVDAAATAIIVLNTNVIFFMCPNGLALATAVYIGRALGAGNV